MRIHCDGVENIFHLLKQLQLVIEVNIWIDDIVIELIKYSLVHSLYGMWLWCGENLAANMNSDIKNGCCCFFTILHQWIRWGVKISEFMTYVVVVSRSIEKLSIQQVIVSCTQSMRYIDQISFNDKIFNGHKQIMSEYGIMLLTTSCFLIVANRKEAIT